MTVQDNTKYYYGQRVVADGKDIVTVIRPPNGHRESDDRVWVQFFNGLVQFRAICNVKPLPNGEL